MCDVYNEVHDHIQWLSELWWNHNIVSQVFIASLTPCDCDRTAMMKRDLHLHRTVAIFSPIGRLAMEPPHDSGALNRGIAIVHPAETSSNGWRWFSLRIVDRVNLDRSLTWRFIIRSTRLVEELHDRGPIEPQSWNLHCGIASTRSRRRPTEI